MNANQPLPLQRLENAIEARGLDAEPGAERRELGAVRADLPQDPSLAHRPPAPEKAILERADAFGDDAVEAADPIDHYRVHGRIDARYQGSVRLVNARPLSAAGVSPPVQIITPSLS